MSFAWLSSESMHSILFASVRSVGTACTLALAGIYLHRRGFIAADGKRTLALISQQVTIPLLFFTKLIYCDKFSDAPCPNIMQSFESAWMLLLWPFYVVTLGLVVGYTAVVLSRTPRYHMREALVACAFSNSTGLPITLLSVIHTNFPATSDLGGRNPFLLLSVYLLVYPVLQWGLGGWILATSTSKASELEDELPWTITTRSATPLTLMECQQNFNIFRREETNKDSDPKNAIECACLLYDSNKNDQSIICEEGRHDMNANDSCHSFGTDITDNSSNNSTVDPRTNSKFTENLCCRGEDEPQEEYCDNEQDLDAAQDAKFVRVVSDADSLPETTSKGQITFWRKFVEITGRCVTPPVLGAVLGMIVASTPSLRGFFLNIENRKTPAPLEWMFDGFYSLGQAAVPINMILLGINLSTSFGSGSKNTYRNMAKNKETFSSATKLSIVLAKLVIMPMLGFLSIFLFRSYIWYIPEGKKRHVMPRSSNHIVSIDCI